MGLINLLSKIFDADDSSSKSSTTPSYAAQQPDSPNYQMERTPAEWHAYFKEILITDFPQYSFMENVPVANIVGFVSDEFKLYETRPRRVYRAEWGIPYTFVLYQGSSIKGVVMLGSGNSHDTNVKYLISRMFAKKSGIPYINFYTQMPNEKNYVVGRIQKLLLI